MSTIKVFDYIEDLDAFLVRLEFTALSERLGLTEWSPVVWIGRLFMLDNDYGEHWFDNWDEREVLEERAAVLGIASYDLMVVLPSRITNSDDGPCNSSEVRKAFWTDVLKSLTLSYELIFEKARHNNSQMADLVARYPDLPVEVIANLEERIAEIKATLV